MASRTLHLDIQKTGVYRIHPLVVFSILDHHKRREAGVERVVGTLLGYKDGETVHVTNCYPVPHTESGSTITFDKEHHQRMAELHHRVNPKERVLGWYSSSAVITANSLTVHGVYLSSTPAPLLLTVDAELTADHLDVKAYIAHAVAAGGRPLVTRFEEVELYHEASESESIALDALLNSTPDNEEVLDAPASLQSDLGNLEISLGNLLRSITTVRDYVARVADGSVKGDDDLCRAISHALAAVPTIDRESFDRLFSTHVQDLLLIVYLSNLTRAQLALSDRVIGLL